MTINTQMVKKAIFLLLLTASAMAAEDKKPTAPVLSPEQKLQVKDHQLNDTKYALYLLQLEKQYNSVDVMKKANEEDMKRLMGDLCKSPKGKFHLDFNSLTCVEDATAPEVKK